MDLTIKYKNYYESMIKYLENNENDNVDKLKFYKNKLKELEKKINDKNK